MGTFKSILKKKYSHYFYKYLFSYVLLLVFILLILSSVVYGEVVDTLQQEVENSNIAALAQVRDSMDTRLKEMQKIAMQIAFNPKLTPFMVSNGEYDSYQAVSELGRYISSNAFISDIVLYYDYNNAKTMYAANGTYSTTTFFGYIYKYENWSERGFADAIKTLTNPTMRPVELVKGLNNIGERNLATYLYPLPVNSSQPIGVVMFLIEDKSLIQMIQGVLQGHNGYVCILDRNEQPIVAYNQGFYDSKDIFAQLDINTDRDFIKTIDIRNKPSSVINVTSDYNGWSYMVVMPTDQFMRKASSSRRVFDYTVVGVLAAGIVMAFIFAARNYKPLRTLAETLKKQKLDNGDAYQNDEIDYIFFAIDKMAEENKKLTSQLKNQAALMRDQIFTMLLKRKFQSKQELQEMLDISGIKLINPYFTVMVFLIDNYDSFKNSHTKAMQDMLKYSLTKAVEELSSEIGSSYGLDILDERGIVLVLNMNDVPNKRVYIGELAHKAKDFCKNNLEFTLTIGIGNIYDDILRLADSFEEANSAAYYRLIIGMDQIVFFDEIKKEQHKEYWYPVKQEECLLTALKHGDVNGVERNINSIIANIKQYYASPEAAQFVCYGIINTVMKAISQMDVEAYNQLTDKMVQLFVQPFEKIDILEDKMFYFCKEVCTCIETQKNKSHNISEDIMSYIQNHYNDKDICLDSIASYFHLSVPYTTQIFKKYTNYSLMHYIDMFRMNKAKELLKSTHLTVKEIIGEVGYWDESNFIRKFKRIEGLTPIQYRGICS